ncbi:MAG TPA: beta-ketoacyl synthase N-terminal-like domain-containing protein, partial [Pseudonocardiaceae bacterium]|nr:beta-ketoacyl synthase N-terminal-like domain-containing protein [Pseudonocardiaceae bacterium]
RAGARRFVFEGSECGGHVGPRSSFDLWEAQCAVLAEHLDHAPADEAARLQVFFAGGIHDARSAAMVAALAGDLTRRGVEIGVLMGTAYLFTEEAVAHGAIQPLFQRKALAAAETALLETAPGHVTRCLISDYVEEFRRRRDVLNDSGVDRREVWERLELLNTGRLRLASRGRAHDGAVVDEAGQSAEGLYMAGQVAVLRSSPTTVAALHHEVSVGAARLLAERVDGWSDRRETIDPRPVPRDVAIIGMACAFPGSPDLAGFWRMILGAQDAITEVPVERWDQAAYYTSDVDATVGNERVISRWGGFLDRAEFDPIRFGIPPAALGSIDPSQLLGLDMADRTLVDAGYRHDALDADHSRTGVVFGAQFGGDVTNGTMIRSMLPGFFGEVPREFDEQLPAITEDTFPGILPNVIAGRIANRLNLGGVNFTVDAACAASLAAVDVACKELTTGAADLMLCGGVDLHNGICEFIMFGSVRALSATGRARTFDQSADGTALGEGVACVALKRLADAQRDGDRIYAVIKGVGSASDGRSLGLTAPSPTGQLSALRRAYREAGVSPRSVALVEAHGTGTIVGDRTELQSLTAMFGGSEVEPGGCVLGSVKSQIGHTKSAAGLAGLIKAAMAVYTGVQPPTLHLTRPNSAWDPADSPFSFLTRPRPWLAQAAERVAGVSAFGFGGTNFHVILSGHSQTPEPRHASTEWPAELFVFRGTDREAAVAAVRGLHGALARGDGRPAPRRLRELAAENARDAGTRIGPVRIAIVARDLDELGALAGRALAGEHDPAAGLIQPSHPPDDAPPAVAFLFPGQGSQRPGALAELFVHFPELRQFLRDSQPVAARLFPTAAFDAAGRRVQSDRLRETSTAQPALGIAGLAAHHLLGRLGIRPDLVAGHSYGELVALCVAGSFDPATLLSLSAERADAMLAAAGADPGTMAAVAGTPDQVSAVLAAAGLLADVVLANHNAPAQVVISGPTAEVGAATGALDD